MEASAAKPDSAIGLLKALRALMSHAVEIKMRNDVIGMGRQHIRDDVLTARQQKTGIELAIPV